MTLRVLALACVIIMLGACTTTFRGLCAAQVVGVNDAGLSVLAVQCEALD